MEITISGVPDYVNPDSRTKPDFDDVVMYPSDNPVTYLKGWVYMNHVLP